MDIRVDERRSSLSSVRDALAARKAEVACAVLLLGMAANFLVAIPRKSITNDELYGIPAGYYYFFDSRPRVDVHHPPLAFMWDALPLLALRLEVPSKHVRDEPDELLNWAPVERFWTPNRDRFRAIIFWTRCFASALAIALGALLFAFARTLFGRGAAVLAVALYSVEPTVLAHGRSVLNDIPSAAAYLLFFMAALGYVRRTTWQAAALVGVATGVALATKFSMIVLLPLLAGLAFFGIVCAPRFGQRRATAALHAGLCVLAMLVVVNAAYCFTNAALTPSQIERIQLESPTHFTALMSAFRLGSIVVPTQFMFGLYSVALQNQHGLSASLLGEYRSTGWWYYFPVAFALKTSLPFAAISCAALAWSTWNLVAKRDVRFLVVIGPFALYMALAMSSRFNIGIRHILPVFPFLFVASGALLDRLWTASKPRALGIAVVVLTLGWASVEAVRAFPDYIPYMNQFASGHPKWWYLSDSNVEWGDDLQALATYLQEHDQHSVRGALSAGWELTLYGISYQEMWSRPAAGMVEPKYVAIGASFLNGSTVDLPPDENGDPVPDADRVNYFAAFRNREPEAVFGGTIYLYRAP